jgi:hypothetical protein
MKKWLYVCPAFLLLLSCKEKEAEPQKDYISILSYIHNQVADVDTSLYSIIRLDYIDSTRTDTSYIRREDFRSLANDFLALPDIADRKNRKDYREETRFDEMLNSVVITYLPVKPEKALIQRQEMLITPQAGGDKVRSIFIDYLLNNRDSIIQKRMLWQVDRSFQVTTIRQKAGGPETIATMKVVWNEPENP